MTAIKFCKYSNSNGLCIHIDCSVYCIDHKDIWETIEKLNELFCMERNKNAENKPLKSNVSGLSRLVQ